MMKCKCHHKQLPRWLLAELREVTEYSYSEDFRLLLLSIGVFLVFFNNKKLQMETTT